MPSPTPEQDALALIVEDAAKALAELMYSPVFGPGYDTVEGQRARDVYREQARTVINCSRARIEAPLIARYRPDVEMLERIREWASTYPTLPPEVVAQVYEFKTMDLEMATVERVRYLLAGGTFTYLRRDSEGDDRG